MPTPRALRSSAAAVDISWKKRQLKKSERRKRGERSLSEVVFLFWEAQVGQMQNPLSSKIRDAKNKRGRRENP
jgi:hypothetical protein